LRELSNGHRDEAAVAEHHAVRLLLPERHVAEVEGLRRDRQDPPERADLRLAGAPARGEKQHTREDSTHAPPPAKTPLPRRRELHAPCQGSGRGAGARFVGTELPSRGRGYPGRVTTPAHDRRVV